MAGQILVWQAKITMNCQMDLEKWQAKLTGLVL